MNFKLLSRMLGILSMLIGVFMLFSIPWAFPSIGFHTNQNIVDIDIETRGIIALLTSTLVCLSTGGLFLWLGRRATGKLFLKEAMAVVGLAWVLATFLGALPYYLYGVSRGPSVRIFGPDAQVQVADNSNWQIRAAWRSLKSLDQDEYELIRTLLEHQALGVDEATLLEETRNQKAVNVFEELAQREYWNDVLIGPGQGNAEEPADRAANYRIRWVKMSFVDALFESQSGFSTTGATVISNLEDPQLVPHCILFWRSSTHFLGGLGIIVLFVAILGHGSAGKTLVRTEMPGPTSDGSMARVQQMAWMFAAIYVGLNMVLAIILAALGMSPMDAICHAFGTMATGGFSTFNSSLGAFNSPAIEYVVTLFMVLAGTNFTLLYFLMLRRPGMLFADVEWRTYIAIILVVTSLVMLVGVSSRDDGFEDFESALRNGVFQVVSIVTTTGYGTCDFDRWSHLSRALLLILMFIGGCAGSTGGGMKVIRHLLCAKILWMEIEKAFHPRVVRLLKLGNKPVEDQNLRNSILVYFGLVTFLFLMGWLFVIAFEPNESWGPNSGNKMIDSASAVAATLNNIGPGLGTVGATENYGHFTALTKMLFVVLMMLGRLEIFPILVLIAPRFWRDQ